MYKIWLLTRSNIRKNKGLTISLFMIILIAAILLHLGLLSSFDFKKSFHEESEKLHTAHALIAMPESFYENRFYEFVKNYPGVTETEKENIIYLKLSQFKYGVGKLAFPAIVMNANEPRVMSKYAFAGDTKSFGDHDIYVSYIMKTGGGYHLGDDFTIQYMEKQYTFKIAGFIQDSLLGGTNSGCIGFYLPKRSYLLFQEALADEDTKGIMIKARVEQESSANDLLPAFAKNELGSMESKLSPYLTRLSYPRVERVRTLTANIGGAIITSFSIIIVLVSLIVIKFRISDSIEDTITEIGTLKAMGYVNRQIIGAIVIQFLLISASAALTGVGSSYLILKPLSLMFSAQTGILWKPGFSLFFGLVCAGSILFAVLLMVTLSTQKIKKLHPIIALRAGISTHNFKKNYWPIYKTGGNLHLILALKNLVVHFRQNIMIAIIVTAVSFCSVFGIIMYYNIVKDGRAFNDMIGMEMCSVSATVVPGKDAGRLSEEIKMLPGVRKALPYDCINISVMNETVMAYVTDDYDDVDNHTIYQGRYPKFDNEIAVNGYLADYLKKQIGDIIILRMGENEKDYIITGLMQSVNMMGMDLNMTMSGVKQLQPAYQYNTINIYLEKQTDVESFLKDLNDRYQTLFLSTTNMDKFIKSQLGVYRTITTIFAYFILVITALVVALILYLIIKAMIIRRKKEFGIQKAIGFTTIQLMMQISISFLPLIMIGSVTGCILGGIYINPLCNLLFHGMGSMNTTFIVPIFWIVALCAGICLVSYLISMVVSYRIRKISVYSLIVE